MQDLMLERVVPWSLNGASQSPFLCTPDHLDELAYGHLLAQGAVKSGADIASVSGDESGLSVVLAPGVQPENKDILARLSACAPIAPGFIVPLSQIRAMCTRLLKDSAFYGTHRLMIAWRQNEVFREDIGRHNAADKVIAFAARGGWDFSSAVLGSTGRISFEMLAKCAQMGIPVFFSRKYPSDLSIEWAKKLGIALVARTFTDAPDVYGAAERIV